jgi:16S rRNA (adenine1518-N6/adenine1519-N6)-dimethyltransferase
VKQKTPSKKSRTSQAPHFAFDLNTQKSLGQHFLADTGVIADIEYAAASSLPVGSAKRCLEIGPGSGALTKQLLAKKWDVLALEKDERAVEGLASTLALEFPETFQVRHQDILKYSETPDTRPLCVGNLPYYITSDILFWFCERAEHFGAAVFMIQDEVADRLNAKPGTKAYGRLTVRMQLACDVEKLFTVPAKAFIPPPKVNSAVIRLTPKKFGFENAAHEKHFSAFTATLFSARRKMLRRALANELGLFEQRTGQSADLFWQEAAKNNVRPETRPDAIAPEAIWALHSYFWKALQVK